MCLKKLNLISSSWFEVEDVHHANSCFKQFYWICPSFIYVRKSSESWLSQWSVISTYLPCRYRPGLRIMNRICPSSARIVVGSVFSLSRCVEVLAEGFTMRRPSSSPPSAATRASRKARRANRDDPAVSRSSRLGGGSGGRTVAVCKVMRFVSEILF